MATKKIQPHAYMARYTGDPTYCDREGCNAVEGDLVHQIIGDPNDFDSPDTITIERREIIARISPYQLEGAIPMLEAAWQVAGQYVSENAGDQPVQVQFDYHGWRHTARSEAIK